jgi:phospholipase/lecithinase/hemolysin
MVFHSGLRRHVLRTVAATAAVVLLASCGSDDDRNVESVASFGDSLSDLGTYRWGQVEAAGGGRYTTNPGKIWVEHVADHYDAPITRNRTGGAGNPSPQVLGGLGYAQGGARVSQLPGVGSNTNGVGNTPMESAALPIREQVSAHLAASGNSIPRSQLILMFGGANDVFHQFGVFSATATAPGVTAGQVAAAQQAALTGAATAGTELAGEVRRLVAAGASKVVVVDVPDIAPSPFAQSLAPEPRALLTAMVQALNQALGAGLDGVSGVTRIGGSFFEDVSSNPSLFGFSNSTQPACTFPTPQQPSSLYCSPATLAVPNADTEYQYADGVHPTTAVHRQFGAYVIARLATSIP